MGSADGIIKIEGARREMMRVAIVEDDNAAAERLESYLNRFSEESGEATSVRRFSDPVGLLNRYAGFDLVLMDIEMPNMNGMEGARRLREIDHSAKLIFVTNMAQYAAKGYEVEAMDFLVKPVVYSDFAFKMKRVQNAIRAGRKRELLIPIAGGIVRENADELVYVEVIGHRLTYHFMDRTVEARGTIGSTEEALKDLHLMRPHNSYLINPKFIDRVQSYTVTVNGEELSISRNRRKDFLQQLGDWYAKGGV